MKRSLHYTVVAPALLAILLGRAATLDAAVFTVTSLADSGPGSLRDRVAASAAGDTIVFATNGTIVLNAVIFINHTLSVQGPGPAKLTVSGNHLVRVFVTTGNPVVLSGMTIRDGFVVAQDGTDADPGQNGGPGGDAYGGAIVAGLTSNDSLVISNCWLTGNRAQGGKGGTGGINPVEGPPVSPGKGGPGGYAYGGALYANGSNIAVNCTFSDNRAIGGQGGTGGENIDSRFDGAGPGGQGGNGEGGAANVSSAPGWPSFTNCTFSGNSAIGGQGGLGGTNSWPLTGGSGGTGGSGECGAISLLIKYDLISCTIVSNTAVAGPGGPGGIGTPAGPGGAPGSGEAGGICGYNMLGCVGQMGNTILADNLASTIFSNAFINVDDLGFNYVGDNDFFGTCGAMTSTRIGSDAAPLHPLLGPLAQNGGGLPTHAPLPGSPVIDWGNRLGTTTDERHAPRPVGSPAITDGDGSDIGAVEFGSTPMGVSIGGTNGSQVLITWPVGYGDFTLQTTSNLLMPGSWMGVTDQPVVVGDFFVVTNRISDPLQFFRLKTQ